MTRVLPLRWYYGIRTRRSPDYWVRLIPLKCYDTIDTQWNHFSVCLPTLLLPLVQVTRYLPFYVWPSCLTFLTHDYSSISSHHYNYFIVLSGRHVVHWKAVCQTLLLWSVLSRVCPGDNLVLGSLQTTRGAWKLGIATAYNNYWTITSREEGMQQSTSKNWMDGGTLLEKYSNI